MSKKLKTKRRPGPNPLYPTCEVLVKLARVAQVTERLMSHDAFVDAYGLVELMDGAELVEWRRLMSKRLEKDHT